MSRITNNQIIEYVLDICNSNNKSKTNSDESNYSDNSYEIDSIQQCELDDSNTLNNLPDPLNNISDELINEKVYRIGTKHNNLINNKKCNTSLYWSVLTCLIPDFYEKLVEDRIDYINKLVIKLVFEINTTSIYKDNRYIKLGWKKGHLVKNLQTCTITEMVVKFLSDYFSLNIFVLNIQKGVIHSYYKEDYLNKFKKNIFLLKLDNIYEPIFVNKCSIFNYNDILFQIIIDHNKNLIRCPNIDYSSKKSIKLFRISNEDLNLYLNDDTNENEENKYDELIDSHTNNNVIDLNDSIDTEIDIQNQSEDIFYKKEKDIYSSNIKSISLKLKLKELQNVAIKLNLNIHSKNKTKSGILKKKTKQHLYDDIVKLLT
jgi:hypothetical protein